MNEIKNVHKNNKFIVAKKSLVVIYLLLLSFFVCLLSRQNAFASSTPYTDSSVFMTIAKGMMSGKVPYRDFFDHKGPLLYIMNLLGYSLGGIHGVWLVEIIAIVISVLFSYATVKKLYSPVIALCSTTIGFLILRLCMEGGNLTEEYAMPLISVALYIFVSIVQSDIALSWQALVLGGTFGLSLMLRPNMFSVWFVFSAYWVISHLIKKDFGSAIKYTMFFALGTVISVLPFMIYLVLNQAFSDYIFQNFMFNSQYARCGIRKTLRQGIEVTYSLSYSIVLSFVACIIGFFTSKKNNQSIFVLLSFSIILSIFFVSYSQTVYGHYYIVFVPLVAVAVSVFFELLKSVVIQYGVANKILDLIVFGIALCFIFNGIYSAQKDIFNTINDAPNKEIISLVETLNKYSSENETIQVLNNECSVYLYSDLKPANKFIYDHPVAEISSDVHKQFVQEWKKDTPTYIITDDSYLNGESEHIQWLVNEIENNYKEIHKTDNFVLFEIK